MTDRTPPRATAGWIVLAILVASSLSVLTTSGLGEAHPSLALAGPSVPASVASGPIAPPSGDLRTLASLASHPRPSEITSGMGWEGVDYRDTCATCVPADPQLGVGAGYVFEMTNGTDRIWLINGTQVANQSLDALFGAGSDQLTHPEVQFDPTSLHWFISANDVTTDQIRFGGSLTSDPMGSWNVQSFTPGSGSVVEQPLLAVDGVALVVTTDVFATNGSFEGAQVWAANKSDLMDGGAVRQGAVDAPDPSARALVPANPLGSSVTIYLVDDGPAANNSLHLYTVTGSPPGTTTLTGPTNFSTNIAAPPNAVQPGTTNLVNVGDARVASATWRSGTLWAVGTGACTPAGDSQVRSCLHLWEVATATSTLEQDFTWSSGAGTYDFDPAVSIAVRGDLALVFGESSASLYPSFLASGQGVTDASGTLESPVTLHNGTGPDNSSTACSGGICSFGSGFSIAFTPSTNVHLWAVGEYGPRNGSADSWKTWVNQVAAWASVPVTFTESALPTGTLWSVTVNGEVVSSTNSTLTIAEVNGSYSYSALTPIPGGAGVRYVAAPSAGSFTLSAKTLVVTISYVQQFQLSTSTLPVADGLVFPGAGWFNSTSTVSLSALASSGWQFASWAGTGAGSYSGPNNPASVVMGAPIAEVAHFWESATYPVTFSESGLPTGTPWTVTVNGVSNGGSGSSLQFNEPNGTYSFTSLTPIPGTDRTQYVASPTSGAFDLSGVGTSVDVAYLPQFQLAASPTSLGLGVVNPSGGWFSAGASVNLSALAGPGELFVGWSGSGSGSYTGAANPAPVVMDAPVTEAAHFAPTVTYPVTYTETGLPAGTAWTATTNGVPSSTATSSIVFNEPNGSYSFGAQTSFSAINGTAYTATPAYGAFVLAGSAVHEAIQFSPSEAKPTSPGAATGTAAPSGVPIWVFGAALAALLIVIAILAAFSLRRPGPPSGPTPASTVPAPRPEWDEGA
ncbi:MAG: hypothetical protein L3K10_04705 [Thermoplasmata archaeon]|nr:hypothetical protein [Thermoplasmata archaeon]